MENKTEFKAKKRLDYKSPDFTAIDIDLNFQLADANTIVRNTAHYVRLTADTKAPLRLDGVDLTLNDVLINGQSCRYTVTPTKLIVYDVPDDFELTTECVIAPGQNTSLMGLYKSSGCFCTQCEPEGFRKITYFLDRPDVLAKYKVTIVAPEYGCGVLLSNGNLVDSGVKNGRRYTVWEDPFPKPSYLFALVAGSFDIIEDTFVTRSGREVQLSVYVDRGAHDRGLWAMESIKEAMAWDERRFNLEYDLDNFKVVAVDFFNFGAMENKSLNIFNSSCVLVDSDTASDNDFYRVQGVIGHEYFHNWTGDRVTLRDWFQLSLKESLTVFRDQEFSSDVNSRVLTRLAAINLIRTAQFAEDAGPMAHPIRPEQVMEMNNFYTVTIYDKGAEVIRMIHTILGEELFQKGIANYIERFDGSSATIEDFILAMETASMTDLTQFRRWYSQAGTPEVHAKWLTQNGKLVVTLNQSTPPTPGQKKKEPFVIPIRTSFLDPNGNMVTPVELPPNGVLMLKEESQDFEFSDLPEGTIPVVLRDFSAPVKLTSMYTTQDYVNMLEHCDDMFIRVDAQMSLITNFMRKNVDKALSGELSVPDDLIKAFDYIISDSKMDVTLQSLLVRIPTLSALMENFKSINLDSLVVIRRLLKRTIASNLLNDYKALEVKTRSHGRYRYSTEGAARRALHHSVLDMVVAGYLEIGRMDEADDLVFDCFSEASNMTDRISAYTMAVHYDLPCKIKVIEIFTENYKNDPLVFDNFFRVYASVESEETVNVVRKLLDHPCFDITNPNRVRALIGTMAYANPVALHRKDGMGYLLLLDVIKKLDPINPSVAARILDGIIQFKRFDSARASKARDYLERMSNIPNLSKAVYEKISAALAEQEFI